MVDSGFPVWCEDTLISDQPASDLFGEGRPEYLQLIAFASGLVPAAPKETRVVYDVVEMVVGEEQIVTSVGNNPAFTNL